MNFFEIIIFVIVVIVILCIYFYKNKKVIHQNIDKLTIIDILQKTAKTYPHLSGLCVQKGKSWISITYSDYYKYVKCFAKGLSFWIGPNPTVAIYGFNSPAWFYAHLGCMMCSGVSVCINNLNQIQNMKIDVLVIEGDNEMTQLKDVSNISMILYYSPISDKKNFNIPIISFGEFINYSDNSKEKVKIIKPKLDDVACVIFTKGTTDQSKGVLIKHVDINGYILNMTSVVDAQVNEKIVSYVPLCDIMAQIFDIYLAITIVGSVWFPSKKNINKQLKEINPTLLYSNNNNQNIPSISNCKIFSSIYYTCETGPIALSSNVLPNVSVKIDLNDEILVNTPYMFCRYYHTNDRKLYHDKWFRTGDIGYIKNKKLYITGKKQNIVTLKNGKKIDVSTIEKSIKKKFPEIIYCYVTGTNFLIALLFVKNENIEKKYEKIPHVKKWKVVGDIDIDFKRYIIENKYSDLIKNLSI